jgi:hypothetical protein
MRATQFIKGVAEGYQFKGPFPFDVDHMHGGRGINLPKAETKKYFTDKKQWQQAVDDINSSKYDDNSDYIGVTGRSTVEINGREWARWSDAQQKGYIELSSMSEQGMAEGDVDEGLGSKLAGLGLAGAMALGSAGAQARVSGDQDPNINRFTGKPVATQQSTDVAPAKVDAPSGYSKEYLQRAADPNRTGRYMISVEKAQELLSNMKEGADNEKIGGRYDADDFDDMVSRLKKLAGAGPMRTVYDPDRRVYRNMPTAQQPAQQSKKAPR